MLELYSATFVWLHQELKAIWLISLEPQPIGDAQIATTPKLIKSAKMANPAARTLVENANWNFSNATRTLGTKTTVKMYTQAQLPAKTRCYRASHHSGYALRSLRSKEGVSRW
jgi:hypothetical protein